MPDFTKVIGINFKHQDFIPIEISSKNKDLRSFDTTSAAAWEYYIQSYLKKNNAKVAFGGYLEERNLYERSDYFQSASDEEKRNKHLGVDFWSEAGTPVFAIQDGKIHSFKNNTNFGDYGPTLIVEHSLHGLKLYSLYGHLSLESIENKTIGQYIKKGEQLGNLGTSDINGNYAPHLHLQIIYNLEGNFGDYPGVCSKKMIKFYKENCPNPMSFID